MSALVFSHYRVTGSEGADFSVGTRPVLDPYDGFFDQALDKASPGDELLFLLNEGQFRAVTERMTTDSCHAFRDALKASVAISGQIIETQPSVLFQVERREPFLEVIQRKPLTTTNEVIAEVARYTTIWDSIRAARGARGGAHRFHLEGHLPRVSSAERAVAAGAHCEPRMNFGSLSPTPARTGLPLLLIPRSEFGGVRVVAIGGNDINSCRVFDVTDVAGYRTAIATALQNAVLAEETNFWAYLLG